MLSATTPAAAQSHFACAVAICSLLDHFLLSLALGLLLARLGQLGELIVNLLLVVLELVPVLFIVVSKLLAKEELDRRVLTELLGALPCSIQVTASPCGLLVPQEVVLLGTALDKC